MTLHTIVIPTLNEEAEIQACLMKLQGLRKEGFEVIVVDGGSIDKTPQLVKGLCDQFISNQRGRAAQMNIGARYARGELFFFLHVDTQLPEKFSELIPLVEADTFCWGRFDVTLSGERWPFRVIETMMNMRSRLTGIATGDQVMFVSKKLYQEVDGFPEIALMEDIAMSQRLKNICSPTCLRHKVITSSRRWEKHGIISTTLKMWWLRLSYFVGVDPVRLARLYE
jgi:rSAM/selenodomain-associated transferase 2